MVNLGNLGNRRFGLGPVAMELQAFHADAEGAFELEELGALVFNEERGSDAEFAGAAGAANAVDEVFGDFGQIVVDDVGDVLDVDAARSEVGGHEDAVTAALETFKGGGALGLGAVSVNHGGVDALAIEALGDAFGAALGAGEDQAAAGLFAEQVEQRFVLAIGGNLESLEANIFRGLEGGTEGETNWVSGVVLHEASHGAFHGGGETHGLAFLRKNGGDSANGREKAHVQHAVRFIEDESMEIGEMDELAVEIIFEAAGSSDDEPGAVANGHELRAFGQSTDNQSRGRKLVAQSVILRDNLHRQFARGNEDEGSDSGSVLPEELFDQGHEKRQGLAGSGLRGGEDILSGESLRNSRSLNGSWRGKASCREACLEARRY